MSNVCLKCIGDQSLRALAKKKSIKIKCEYCGVRRLGLSLSELAEIVDPIFRRYYGFAEFTPVFHGDSDRPDWEQSGESLEFVLQEELEMDLSPVEDLMPLLSNLDPFNPHEGEDAFYTDCQNYCRCHFSSWEFFEKWTDFSSRTKHHRRFFDDEARSMLSEILGEPSSVKHSELPTFQLGAGSRVEVIFRARRADTEQEAISFFRHGAKELSPPPPEIARAGRMNSTGISVFYGAISEDTAISEVRPFVGSIVVVGKFNIKTPLTILDLSRIGEGFTGSLFDPNSEKNAARLRFLQGFHSLIAQPIQPHEEQLEYLPTQAVAEYVSNVLGFDGILYGSAQLGATPDGEEDYSTHRFRELSDEALLQHNIVLFGKAARVATIGDDEILAFEEGSATAVKVSRVTYTHNHCFLAMVSTSDSDAVSLNDTIVF